MTLETRVMTAAASRLLKSSSPYLRQHAGNPVEWFCWGEEALSAARAGNKPIFLSIGYSTCHWCHVMAHESFENDEIAKIMNEKFVNIKVDREERPDLDRQYMLYVQATTGSGGWPLSVFLSPNNLVPIFGGTYFGPQDQSMLGGRASFKTILEIIADKWKSDSKTLERTGTNLVEQMKKLIASSGNSVSADFISRIKSIKMTFLQLSQTFDSQFGGFGSNTKFPMPGTTSMLLRFWALLKDLDQESQFPPLKELQQHFGASTAKEAKEMILFTLKNMARGGIHDHVAGGFHRYTVDRAWTLPHFEKMLYDQAQLIKLYSEAYLVFDRDPQFESIVKRAINYVKERLMDPQSGAFYSAEDADSLNPSSGNIEEGAFAVWTDEEINSLLHDSAGWSIEDVKLFKYHFTILPSGNLINLTQDPHLKGKNVLVQLHQSSLTAEKYSKSVLEINQILDKGLKILYEHRIKNRPFPHRDEKIIASWNGLMIEALSVAYRVFGEKEYLEMAQKCVIFIESTLTFKDPDGKFRLWRSYFDGMSSGIQGFAEDYASIISGLIELNQTLRDPFAAEKALNMAESLQASLDSLFSDKVGGGYYDSLPNANALFRIKDDYDGVEPSANSLTALNCLKLNLLTGKKIYYDNYYNIINLFGDRLNSQPQAMTTLVAALIMDSAKPSLITLTKNPDLVMNELNKRFLPHVLVKLDLNEQSNSIGNICKGNVCGAPETDLISLLKQVCDI